MAANKQRHQIVISGVNEMDRPKTPDVLIKTTAIFNSNRFLKC